MHRPLAWAIAAACVIATHAAAEDAKPYKVVDGYKELRDFTELGGSLTVFALPQ